MLSNQERATLLVVLQGSELFAKICFKVVYHLSRWSCGELSRKLPARQFLFDCFFFAFAIHIPNTSGETRQIRFETSDPTVR
ncbi:hypothetical protein ACVIN2_003666 [Bradyrhizobium sp. USDA 3650]